MSSFIVKSFQRHYTSITVGGTDVVVYRYKLDAGSWGGETVVGTHIGLSGLGEGSHTVYVIGKDTAGNWQSEWGATTASWTVDTAPPPVPALLAPADAAQSILETVVLEWSVVSDAAGVNYQLQVDTEADFGLPIVTNVESLTASAYTTGALADGTYYWRVKAWDGATSPNVSAWSQVRSFRVDTVSPVVASVNPSQGKQGQTLSGVVIRGARFIDATAVSFGSGVTVTSLTVDSDSQITAGIAITADATLGPRDVSVTCPDGTGVLISGFWVSEWSAMTSGTMAELFAVWGSSPGDVFAVGDGGTILHYNGSTWSPMTSGTASPLYGVWGCSWSDVFAVGADGIILHYDGTAWNPMLSGTTQYIRAVWGSAANDVFAVGSNGTILRYNGSTWNPMMSRTTRMLLGVWGSSASDVFAVGGFGAILHYNGSLWTPMSSCIEAFSVLYGVGGSSSSNVLAAGGEESWAGGTPFHSVVVQYDGANWSFVQSGSTLQCLNGVWGTSAVDYYAVGPGGTILHYNGSTWSPMVSGTTLWLKGVWGSWASDIFAVGSGGIILHYSSLAPSVDTVTPSNGRQNESMSVVITGSYLMGATSVSLGVGVTVNSFSADSDTQITASIHIGTDAGLGARDVWVTTSTGTAALVGGFTVTQAQAASTAITSISPSQGSQGQTINVTIAGTYFTGATSVSFGSGITVNSFTVNSATQMTASIAISSSATLGVRDVSVATPGGTATKTSGFTVNQVSPTITSVSPNQGSQGDTLDVAITGTCLTGATSVSFGLGIAVNNFTVDSDTQIVVNITISGTATAGIRDISATTPEGTGILTSGFTVKEKGTEVGGCSCSHAKASTSISELLIGWGTFGLCLATCYGLARRVGKKGRK